MNYMLILALLVLVALAIWYFTRDTQVAGITGLEGSYLRKTDSSATLGLELIDSFTIVPNTTYVTGDGAMFKTANTGTNVWIAAGPDRIIKMVNPGKFAIINTDGVVIEMAQIFNKVENGAVTNYSPNAMVTEVIFSGAPAPSPSNPNNPMLGSGFNW